MNSWIQTASSNAAAANDGAPVRVLVVSEQAEDKVLLHRLNEQGFVAHGVRQLQDAVDVVATFCPHIVLFDGALLHAGSNQASVAAIKAAHECACAVLAGDNQGGTLPLESGPNIDTVILRPVDTTLLRRMLMRGPRPVVRSADSTFALPNAVEARSPAMAEVWRLVMRAAGSDSSIVITGETGVGKEVVARALHRYSRRQSGPFVAINCAALPDTLLESELFGHEKGAFTGAATRHKGRFELADGGTLFLDEIGDLPLSLQVKLLRVLQERTFQRLGAQESLSVDVRILAATHRDLAEEVRRGRFRADLFYRLNVLAIHVPPLRDRKEDLVALWNNSLAEGAATLGRPAPTTSTAAQRMLLRHDWPGNIRELHNAAQHALTVAEGSILPADLPDALSGGARRGQQRPSLAGTPLDELERCAILDTCELAGTVRSAAELLGISERTLHYRLRRYESEGWRMPRGGAVAVRAESASPSAPQRQPRILLAEDDDEVRWALSEFLRAEGYEVIAVADGQGVLERLGTAFLLEKPPADAIVTDLRIPGITGMQLLEGIRARSWEIPVILITAFGGDDTRERAVSAGATAFMEKPLDVVELRRVLKEVVRVPAEAVHAEA